jgi:hypothetical protein
MQFRCEPNVYKYNYEINGSCISDIIFEIGDVRATVTLIRSRQTWKLTFNKGTYLKKFLVVKEELDSDPKKRFLIYVDGQFLKKVDSEELDTVTEEILYKIAAEFSTNWYVESVINQIHCMLLF